MRPRTALADALADGLPATYRVLDHQAALDRIEATERVVIIWQSTLEPHLSRDRRMVTLDVWVLIPKLDPGRADDDVDDALEDVLTALDHVSWATWTSAERGVYADSFHGYQITVSATTTKD